MGMSDYMLWIHSKGTSDGVDIGHSGDEYSEDEIDFEVTNPNVGAGGANMGLHVLINEVFNTLTSANISICSGAATSPTDILITRPFALAALAAGKHYFIPFPPTVLRYNRAYFDVVGSNPSTGEVCMWFGPKMGGEE